MNTVSMNSLRQQGSGLIEVMVAIAVLGVGVLGFAGLQARALQASGESYYRSQAMAIAQDLAERVRLNREGLSTYVTTSNWSFLTPMTSNLSLCIPTTTSATVTCNAATMATFDMNEIRYRAATMLPSGLVNMRQCPTGAVISTTPLNCVMVSWDGDLPTAGTDGECVNDDGLYNGSPNCVMLEVL